MHPPISSLLWLLAREPFNIPPPVAARMSLHQIYQTLRDPDDVTFEPAAGPFNVRAAHDRWAVLNRVPPWYADKVWREVVNG